MLAVTLRLPDEAMTAYANKFSSASSVSSHETEPRAHNDSLSGQTGRYMTGDEAASIFRICHTQTLVVVPWQLMRYQNWIFFHTENLSPAHLEIPFVQFRPSFFTPYALTGIQNLVPSCHSSNSL
jgi:hypothetical protein